MKRKLRFTIIMPLILLTWISCKKTSVEDQGPITEAKKFEVSFKVNAFSQSDEPFSSKLAAAKPQNKMEVNNTNAEDEDPIENYIRRLDFFIYNGEGQLTQRSASHNVFSLTSKYNEKTFLLEAGSYTMIVIGSMGGLTFGDTVNFSTAYLQPKPVVEDIFYEEYKFDVNETDIHSEVVHLKRIVASLELRVRSFLVPNVNGGPPRIYANSVSRFPFDSDGNYGYLYEEHAFEGENYQGLVLPRIVGEGLWNRPEDLVYQGFVLPDRSGSFNSRPFFYEPASRSGEIGGFYIENVILKPNFKKILTGRDYKSAGGEFIEVTADSAWEDIEEDTF